MSPNHDVSGLPIPLQGVLQSKRAQLQWLRYRTGQPLLQADRLPHQVMFIAEGAVRLIADDPSTGPFTLARFGSGDAVGWCGLVRGIPCEAAKTSSWIGCRPWPRRWLRRLVRRHPPLG